MPNGRPTISTHVLDTAGGRPAAGIHVRCWRLDGEARQAIRRTALTDDDGRIRDLLGGHALAAGRYRLAFELGTGRFFRARRWTSGSTTRPAATTCPLLLSPYGLTTYRGS